MAEKRASRVVDMSQKTEKLWATLSSSGVVSGEAPDMESSESPWYVKALLAFSGWLASILLFGFLAAGFESILDNSIAALIVGSMMISGAYALLRLPKNEFVEHIGLALSLAGQALIAWTIFKAFDNVNEYAFSWMLVALLQIFLAIIMPNFVHRAFSSYLSAFAFSMSLMDAGVPYIFSSVVMFVVAWLWLNEFRYTRHSKKIRAIAYGLVLALVQLKGSVLFGGAWHLTDSKTVLWVQPWMGEVLASVVMLYVVWQLLQKYRQHLSNRIVVMALVGAFFVCAASLEAIGITVGIVIMLLGFSASNRVLLGIGVAALLFYISAYYYLLDITLLDKSLTLLIIGLVLLVARWLMLRIVSAVEEKGHA